MTVAAHEASRRPLTTDTAKADRIHDLLAPASNPAQLWVLTLDDEARQLPLLLPIEDLPSVPEPATMDTLIEAVATLVHSDFCDEFQALFALERLGPYGVTDSDHRWAATLRGACERADVPYAGTFLLSPGGVSVVGP